MLTEGAGGRAGRSGYAEVGIKNCPVMESALDVLSVLGKSPGVVISAKGDAIPDAVAVANIITESMMSGSARVQEISVDTDAAPGIGSMLSTIEIVLSRS